MSTNIVFNTCNERGAGTSLYVDIKITTPITKETALKISGIFLKFTAKPIKTKMEKYITPIMNKYEMDGTTNINIISMR